MIKIQERNIGDSRMKTGNEILNTVSRVISSRWRGRNNADLNYSIKHGGLDRIDERSPGVMAAAGHGSGIDLINRKPNAVQPNKPELPVLGVESTGVSRARLLGNNANLNWSGRCVLQRSAAPCSASRTAECKPREDRCKFIALRSATSRRFRRRDCANTDITRLKTISKALLQTASIGCAFRENLP